MNNDNHLDGYDHPTEILEEQKVLKTFPFLKKCRRYLFVIAIIMIILGTIGLGQAALVSVTSVIFLGVLLLIGGVLQIFHALQGDRELRWSGLVALLYLIAGGIIIVHPIASTLTLTIIITGCILGAGVMRCVLAIQNRPASGWQMLLISGVLSILLALTVLGSGVADLWFIGLMISLELLFDGFGLLFTALALKDLENKI